MRNNPIFVFSLSLVTVFFVIALIVFGFDITTPKPTRRAITHVVQNKGTTAHFYRIDDTFAFGVFTDREPGQLDISITTYERNIVPYCFFCGWYTGAPDDDRYMMQPYLANDYAYSKELHDEDWGGVPAGEYPVFNFKTGEYTHVKDLHELPNFPADSGKMITREYISENYDEISYFSADDEDCMIVYSALFVCYIVLFIWGGIIFIRKLISKKQKV